jgi:hypothetical protein
VRMLIAAIYLTVATATALTFEATPEKASIVSGAPLGLDLTFSLDEVEFPDAHVVVFEETRIDISVTDESGQHIDACPRLQSRCPGGTLFGSMIMLGSDRQVQLRRSFNKWCSTELEPGRYRVQVNVQSIGIAERGEKLRLVAPTPETDTFDLEVKPTNESEFRSHLELLLELAGRKRSGLAKEDRARSAQAVEEIVYATSLSALPYQIKLLRGFVPFGQGGLELCHISDLATHFVALDEHQVAEELVALFRDIQQGRVSLGFSRSQVETFVLWTIHELHEIGNPEVADITRPITTDHPKPSDPRPTIK